MDDYRYRPQQSPRNELTMNNLVSPPRNGGGGGRIAHSSQTHDPRTSLPRRFTTDSGRVPTLSSITNQRGLPPVVSNVSNEPSQEYHQTIHKVQLLEKKKMEYERLREQRRRFELEMQKLEQAQRREELELAKIQDDLRHGHQSEPTTPPEYHDNSGFSSFFSRPNRYSTSSLTSPPGLFNRPGRSGSQLQSPQSGIVQSSRGFFDDHLPSRSVPTTRRNSDEHEKDEAVRQDPSSHRSSNAYNRYSMPVTRSRTGIYASAAELDQTGTARFLFGEEDAGGDSRYGGRTNLDDPFPTLVRREDQMLSASSAALDLALSPSPAPDAQSHGWSSVNRHRTRQSLSTISTSQLNGLNSTSDVGSIGSSRPSSIRHSLDLKFTPSDNMANNGSIVSPTANTMLTSPPKLQSSFSANDVPTVKNASGANNHAQQHFHNHNASIGRIPAGAVRHNRELSNDSNVGSRDQAANFHSIQSALHGNAPPFGPAGVPGQNMPQTSQPTSAGPGNPALAAPVGMPGPYGYYGGPVIPGAYQPQVPSSGGPPMPAYGAHMLAMGMQNMAIAGPSGPAYGNQNFTGYGNLYQGNQSAPRDSQARVIQHRRQLDQEAMQRFHNLPLEHVGGEIYDLCKDQHGCRYLQKKLEERNPDQVHMIWLETNAHVIELMTDPFGNYLCQKLLEYCNDEERTILIQNAAQDMVRIALNQHGTRALQKMIEFVTTPMQVQIIIEALRYRVVDLIQDLNGNHVIQKCLNKLSAPDAQFIFDAVGHHCIEVGTHRHGCCVLQRCIDHADGEQKVWLIGKITEHAPALVQDPFGNYVVQYIIDLNEPAFTEPVVAMFRGRICQLSRHKFSSNVIEKCLRCSMEPSRDMIVEELLAPGEVERILRDNYANYVIQTALEYSSPQGKIRLVECIRPHLAAIRSTPYGRRIQAKVQAFDSRGSASSSGQVTPADNTGGQIPLRPGRNHGMISSTLAPNGGPAASNFPTNGTGNGRNNATAVYPHSSAVGIPPEGHAQQNQNNFNNGGWAPQPPQAGGAMGQQGDQAPSPQAPLQAQAPQGDHTQWL